MVAIEIRNAGDHGAIVAPEPPIVDADVSKTDGPFGRGSEAVTLQGNGGVPTGRFLYRQKGNVRVVQSKLETSTV